MTKKQLEALQELQNVVSHFSYYYMPRKKMLEIIKDKLALINDEQPEKEKVQINIYTAGGN